MGFSMIIFMLAYYGILYRLFQKQSKDSASVLIVFSILLPILQPFFLYAIRDGNKVESKSENKVESKTENKTQNNVNTKSKSNKK